jgi:hypothetical protein
VARRSSSLSAIFTTSLEKLLGGVMTQPTASLRKTRWPGSSSVHSTARPALPHGVPSVQKYKQTFTCGYGCHVFCSALHIFAARYRPSHLVRQRPAHQMLELEIGHHVLRWPPIPLAVFVSISGLPSPWGRLPATFFADCGPGKICCCECSRLVLRVGGAASGLRSRLARRAAGGKGAAA